MSKKHRLRIDTTTGTYHSDDTDEDATPLLEYTERVFREGDGSGFFTIEYNGSKTVLNLKYVVAVTSEEVSNEPPF